MEAADPKKNKRLGRRKGSFRWTIALMLLVFCAVAVGAGAAAGSVIGTGTVQGEIPVTVSQALVAERPEAWDFPHDRRFFSSISDDDTKFSFALEMFRSEELSVLVPIVNRSANDTVAEFSITVPDIPSLIGGVPGLTMEVEGSGEIDDVVRISPDSWNFTAPHSTNGTPDGLRITVKVALTSMAGYFEIAGRVRSTEF